MAVSVLTAATSATVASNPSTPFTGCTHTVTAGSDRLLLVFIAIGDGTDRHTDATPTYGGQALTQISTGANDGNFVGVEVWYLKEAGIAAASNTTVSVDSEVGANSFDTLAVGAVALAGVDQTTPIDTGSVQTSAGTGTSASVTIAIASGNLGVSAISSDAEGGLSSETGTQLYETAAVAGDTVSAAQYSTTAGSTALGWTQANTGYAVLGFEVNAAGGGGTTIEPGLGSVPFTGRVMQIGRHASNQIVIQKA
jgi:hypothetical protein